MNEPLTIEQSRDDLLRFMREYCRDPFASELHAPGLNLELEMLVAVKSRLDWLISLLEKT